LKNSRPYSDFLQFFVLFVAGLAGLICVAYPPKVESASKKGRLVFSFVAEGGSIRVKPVCVSQCQKSPCRLVLSLPKGQRNPHYAPRTSRATSRYHGQFACLNFPEDTRHPSQSCRKVTSWAEYNSKCKGQRIDKQINTKRIRKNL
jgi:hypothetical protein